MEQLLIKGGNPLIGEVSVSGAKNAALPMLAAALLSEDVCRIENVPIIDDIKVLLDSIEDLGVKIGLINREDVIKADGFIDFSAPAATLTLLELIRSERKPFVIGTTGFTHEQKKQIEDASKEVPLLFSPNMSVGVNLLFKMTEMVSSALKGDWDIEIFEAHHRFKKDAPSGTAKRLLEIAKNSVSDFNNDSTVYDRSSRIGERRDDEIGVMVMRGGDVVGEHTVFFAGMGERIELTHRAFNRNTFSRGAVLGVEFLMGKDPGLYSMFDVLGI